MTEKDMTVKELYDSLETLVDEYGDLKVRISYDSGVVATEIKNKPPQVVMKPMRDYSYVIFEGY